jgi:hypothetical protein
MAKVFWILLLLLPFMLVALSVIAAIIYVYFVFRLFPNRG